MDTASLGPLSVSRLCLGTMLMGGATPREDAHRMLDTFVDAGGTFLDTADVYGDGASEQTLAPWLAQCRRSSPCAGLSALSRTPGSPGSRRLRGGRRPGG